MGELSEILSADELRVYQAYVTARHVTGEPPLECSISVADHFGIDEDDVQEIVDRVREAQGKPPIDW